MISPGRCQIAEMRDSNKRAFTQFRECGPPLSGPPHGGSGPRSVTQSEIAELRGSDTANSRESEFAKPQNLKPRCRGKREFNEPEIVEPRGSETTKSRNLKSRHRECTNSRTVAGIQKAGSGITESRNCEIASQFRNRGIWNLDSENRD